MGWGPGPTARLFGLFFRAKLCPFFLRILACRGSFFSPCRYDGGTALDAGLRVLDWGHWAEGSFFFSLQVWWQDGSGCWTEGTGLRALGWGYWTEGTGLRTLGWGHWTEGTGLRALGWGYWTEGTRLRKLDYGYYGLRELTTEWL